MRRVNEASSAEGSAKALSEELRVRDGYELALAAALGGRLSAALVRDVAGAEALLDRAGPDGGSALLAELSTADGAIAGLSAARASRPWRARSGCWIW